MVEHNLWAYSTPVELQFACKDLADRSLGYGVPGVIVDGTDANQVYDATHEAVERAYRGEGASMIEAKLMRMKGHAMHDAAVYVPPAVKEYWKRRDRILRMEKYLIERGWMTESGIEEDPRRSGCLHGRGAGVCRGVAHARSGGCRDGCVLRQRDRDSAEVRRSARGERERKRQAGRVQRDHALQINKD